MGGFCACFSASEMSETALIHRPKSPAICSISLPISNPFLTALNAADAAAIADTGSISHPSIAS